MKDDIFSTEQLYLFLLTPAKKQLLLSTLGFENLLVQIFRLTSFRNALFTGVGTGRTRRGLCSLPTCELGASDKAWLIWMEQDQVQNKRKALFVLTQHLGWGGRGKARRLSAANTASCNLTPLFSTAPKWEQFALTLTVPLPFLFDSVFSFDLFLLGVSKLNQKDD